MTAAEAHMPTREPAHFVIHPVAPTDDDREEPSIGPQGRCPPISVEAGAAQLVG